MNPPTSSFSTSAAHKTEHNLPHFIITIDTEGDNLWANPKVVTTHNAKFLPRFQSLCEKFGFKVCYLTDYDMARSPDFITFAKDAQRRGVAEIGMHLHAWNTPPPPISDWSKNKYHPYLIEFPASVLHEKVAFMTTLLGETFDIQVRSHRAGRWAFDHIYARALVEQGYWVDCSVTPHVSWKEQFGTPQGSGGPNYTDFPQQSYFLDPLDISKPGDSPLLEVPMTIMPSRFSLLRAKRHAWPRSKPIRWMLDHIAPPPLWLRPKKDNLPQMLSILYWALTRKHPYVEFMLHSSEFMQGGSPSFRTEDDIEKLYDNLTVLFETASKHFKGATLSEHYQLVASTIRTNT